MERKLVGGPYHGHEIDISAGVTETLAFNNGRYVSEFRLNSNNEPVETNIMRWKEND